MNRRSFVKRLSALAAVPFAVLGMGVEPLPVKRRRRRARREDVARVDWLEKKFARKHWGVFRPVRGFRWRRNSFLPAPVDPMLLARVIHLDFSARGRRVLLSGRSFREAVDEAMMYRDRSRDVLSWSDFYELSGKGTRTAWRTGPEHHPLFCPTDTERLDWCDRLPTTWMLLGVKGEIQLHTTVPGGPYPRHSFLASLKKGEAVADSLRELIDMGRESEVKMNGELIDRSV